VKRLFPCIMMLICVFVTSCSPAYYTLPSYPQPLEIQKSQQGDRALSRKSTIPNLNASKLERAQTERPQQELIPESSSPQNVASAELVNQARELALAGRTEEALRRLERAVELNAYNGDAFYEMARCWEIRGDHERALTFINRAIAIFRGKPSKLIPAYFFKAAILEKLGRISEAAKIREMARKL